MPTPGRPVAALAGAAQLLAAFMAWQADGTVGLDTNTPGDVRISLVLISLAALPMLALLVSDRGWPRMFSGLVTALLVLNHLAEGPDGVATSGVLVATGAAIGHLVAAALATGPIEVTRFAPR